MNPRTHGACAFDSCVPARHFVGITTGPNNIRIQGVRKREARFAATHSAFPAHFGKTTQRQAGTAHVRSVLHVAVDVVGHLIVHGDVIHLADWQCHVMKSPPVNGGNIQPAIVGNHEAIRIQRVNPNIVIVATPRHFFECFTTVQRFQKAAIGHINFVFVSGRDSDSNVIPGASD